jgi:FKBP-type peptidyl-prolyl cis-trans isomerase
MLSLRTFVGVCALVAAPCLLHAQREKLPPDDYDYVMKTWPDAKESNTGIRYIVEKEGKGAFLQPGDLVMVNYVGKLLMTGKVFDQNKSKADPFKFHVARGEVIEGWDQILQLMRPGDKWLIIVPPELAYGRRGYPPLIPGDASLIFDVEVLGVKAGG